MWWTTIGVSRICKTHFLFFFLIETILLCSSNYMCVRSKTQHMYINKVQYKCAIIQCTLLLHILTSVLNPSSKKEEKHAWQRQTSLTSNLNSSHTEAELWGYNRKGLMLVRFFSVEWAFLLKGLIKLGVFVLQVKLRL